jgi:hypothetical protein
MNGLWVQSGYNNVYFSNARSMARFGLLALNRGIWDTDTLLADTSYFRCMSNTSQDLNLSYGYLWWLNGKESYMLPGLQIVFPGSWAPDAPRDMITALGKNGQFINVVPSQRLIMVRMGEAPDRSYEVPTEFNNDIWRNLNEVICNQTTVEENISPTLFVLKQNYPNPFSAGGGSAFGGNPVTTIGYQLPHDSFVSLKVYDVVGREVATLVSQDLSPGHYSKQWNAAVIPSGMYFYRLQAGSFSETKKLVLLR